MTDQTLSHSFLSEILNFANVALTISILVMLIRESRRSPSAMTIHPSQIPALVIVAVYWTACYLYISFDQPGNEIICNWIGDCSNNWFGAVFIKPALTFTFAVMLSMMARRPLRKKINDCR